MSETLFVSILDEKNRLICNIGGHPPIYENEILQPLKGNSKLFTHPHGLMIDNEESLYISQFLSGCTYPIKLKRV